jgi:hypothetical protein
MSNLPRRFGKFFERKSMMNLCAMGCDYWVSNSQTMPRNLGLSKQSEPWEFALAQAQESFLGAIYVGNILT